jgi:hypothetical protein
VIPRTPPPGDSPSDYFGELRVDTLKLSAYIPSTAKVERCWTDRKRKVCQDEGQTVEAHDGTELDIQQHAPNDNRGFLATGRGIELTAFAKGNTPELAIEFSAERCWNNSLAELTEWAENFLAFWGLSPSGTLVSRVDLACDVPERFTASDVQRFAGRFGSGLSVEYDSTNSVAETIHYARNGSRPLCFRVYNKRAEQQQGGRQWWPEVWDAYGIDDDTPVWRVEFEFRRKRLKERGVDTWQDLTAQKLNSLWTYATTEFARLDRGVWSDVQDASTEPAAERIEAESMYDPELIHSQITGLVKKLRDEGDMSPEDAERIGRILDGTDDEEQELNALERLRFGAREDANAIDTA